MQQSDYEIVGKFGFESRTHRSLKEKQLKKALISNEIEAFFFFIRWNE